MNHVFTSDLSRVPAKIWTKDVEESAMEQISNLVQLPFIHKHVAIMPDVHAGCGSTIGSVIPTKGAIIPAAVGVDLGCGMMAVKIETTLPDNLATVRQAIESAVPHGRSNHGGPGDVGAWDDWNAVPEPIQQAWNTMSRTIAWTALKEQYPKLIAGNRGVNTFRHLGTLGGGNHFIEVCLDESDEVWIMLHSGSRGIGNRIGTFFISLAKEEMQRWHCNVPDADLAYLPEGTQHFAAYRNAVHWAQEYARINRELMMEQVLLALAKIMPVFITKTAVNCHHNYVEMENHFGKNVYVTRKGAVRARKGDLGIIPGSMGARSFIVEGLGNPESFNSCSHGAGRTMSRTKARNTFTTDDLEIQTQGVECKKDESVLDEAPGAYKDIDEVMANQADLVRPLHTLRQIVCVKG